MGEVLIPEDALYGAQTQRAIDNFPISNLTLPRGFIEALGMIKAAAAQSNLALGLIDEKKANAIEKAAEEVISGNVDAHFPIDVFQTGSGTSINMNANEVIAEIASRQLQSLIHPNDDVNKSQSSNDVIPTAIHLSTSLALHVKLIPALKHLHTSLVKRSEELKNVLVTLIGPIELTYPIFSAKTIKGKLLHTWTMENRLHEITIPTRKSEIFALELIDHKTLSRSEISKIALEKIETIPPVTDTRKALGNDFRRPEVRKSWQSFANFSAPEDLFTVAKIRCFSSSGTYMRTLAEIIAEKAGSLGLAFSIKRTKVGHYSHKLGWSELDKL